MLLFMLEFKIVFTVFEHQLFHKIPVFYCIPSYVQFAKWEDKNLWKMKVIILKLAQT